MNPVTECEDRYLSLPVPTVNPSKGYYAVFLRCYSGPIGA